MVIYKQRHAFVYIMSISQLICNGLTMAMGHHEIEWLSLNSNNVIYIKKDLSKCNWSLLVNTAGAKIKYYPIDSFFC